jgi:diguanylate cyclase (GGDEF)-like protein
MKKIYNFRTVIILVVTLSILIIFGYLFSYEQQKIEIPKATPLTIGWKDHATNTYFDLTYDFNLEGNETHGFSIILPEAFEHPQYLLIRGSLQDVIVAINGNIVYAHDLRDKNSSIPYASLWHFIEVPTYSDGQELTVFLYSPFEAMNGKTNEIYYGSYNDLNGYILMSYGNRLVVGLLILFFGLLFSFISLFVDKIKNNDIVYIGLFTIAVSMWMIAESRTLQLFVNSQYIHGGLAYLSLAVLPIPMAVYIKRHVLKDYYKIYNGLIVYYLIQMLFVILLQLFNIMAYFQSVIYVQSSISIGIVITIIILSRETIKNPSKKVTKRFLIYFSVFALIAALEFLSFLLEDFNLVSSFVQYIVLIFMFILFTRYIYVLNQNYHIRVEHSMLERLAYIDNLTGSKNRHAYEEDIDNIFNQETKKSKLSLTYFDFNDLKIINDEFGHEEGDNILRDGYQIIKNSFGKHSECYRIGGDEFSCLIMSEDRSYLDECGKEFKMAIEKYNLQKPYKISISHGIASYDKKLDIKPKDLLRRADQQMYLNKEKNKKSK